MRISVRITLASAVVVSLTVHAFSADTAQTKGYNCVLMGHSFFNPMAKNLPVFAKKAGFTEHEQLVVFLGGPMGTPGWFWEKTELRDQIQTRLKTGRVDLVGMTYCPDIPGAKETKVAFEDYKRWVDCALKCNSDTMFFIAVPWPTFPDQKDEVYNAIYGRYHDYIHGIIDSLRHEHPQTTFFCIPYGKGAIELRKLFRDGKLPEIEILKSTNNRARNSAGEQIRTADMKARGPINNNAIYKDALGHPQAMLKTLSHLVWLRVIYKVDLSAFDYDTEYTTDLESIARKIAEEDPYAEFSGTTNR